MMTTNCRGRQRFYCISAKGTSFLLACLFTLFTSNLWAQQDSTVLVKDSAKTAGTLALDTFVYSHTRKLEAASKIFARWQSALVNIPDTIAIKNQLEQI